MRVALITSFKASKKEPLDEMFERVYRAFEAAGLNDAQIHFSFSDAPLDGSTSSVNRAVKRFPVVEPFVTTTMLPGGGAVRAISGIGEASDFATLHAIAAGVPRSFPFHSVHLSITHRAFGEPAMLTAVNSVSPGILISDGWWVSGRTRSLGAAVLIDAEPSLKKLPLLPDAVAAVLAACGKPTKTVQLPLAAAAPNEQVASIVSSYRSRLAEVLDRAALPHDLPASNVDMPPLGTTAGPKKPALASVFQALGYSCRGETGAFTLTRRTQANLTVQISLDVGTWSNSLTGFFEVHGLGFSARLPLPVSKAALGSLQYPIGDAARWQRIVENLAALAAELDRTFVREIEATAGASPDWYKPTA